MLKDKIQKILDNNMQYGFTEAQEPMLDELLQLFSDSMDEILGEDKPIFMEEQKTDVDLGRALGKSELLIDQHQRKNQLLKGGTK